MGHAEWFQAERPMRMILRSHGSRVSVGVLLVSISTPDDQVVSRSNSPARQVAIQPGRKYPGCASQGA
ncbi:hypothetical protein EAH75_02345 [Rhodanobacter glycinis]|nr:hypothetical protein EAH75_02345 [Rhodanobacter glycinis]